MEERETAQLTTDDARYEYTDLPAPREMVSQGAGGEPTNPLERS